MRTNIEIDDTLIAEAMRAMGVRTKREAVDEALRTALRLARQREAHSLRGKINWDGDLDAMRRD